LASFTLRLHIPRQAKWRMPPNSELRSKITLYQREGRHTQWEHYRAVYMKTLCIVPCGMRKIWKSNPTAGPTPAGEVYTGSFARKCQEYASVFYPGAYVILSAKYGFLWPDDIIPGDYNVTFNDSKTHPIKISEMIESARSKGLYVYDQLVVVAGKHYVDTAKQVFPGKQFHEPLKGCTGNGFMLQRMTEAIRIKLPL